MEALMIPPALSALTTGLTRARKRKLNLNRRSNLPLLLVPMLLYLDLSRSLLLNSLVAFLVYLHARVVHIV